MFSYLSGSGIIAFITFYIYFLRGKKIFVFNVKTVDFYLFLSIIFVCTFGFLFHLHPYTVILYLKILVLSLLIYYSNVKKNEFLSFVNITYLFYLFFSYLLYFNIIPNIAPRDLNVFNDSLLGIVEIKTLIGIEGSTASIDSYSGIVVLLNLFYNKSKFSKFLMILISFFSMLLTTRMTPLVAMFFSAFVFVFIRSKYSAILILLTIMSVFLTLLYLLYCKPEFTINIFGLNVKLSLILSEATHSRSLVWYEQIKNVLQFYNIYDYIFGYFEDNITHVVVFKGWYKHMINPHNSYIFLFFLSPFLLILFYINILIKIFNNFNNYTYPIIFFILLAGFTTQKIFVLENPIYLIILSYLLLKDHRNFNKKLT